MSLLSRLFSKHGDDRAPVRPLWHRIVEIARERHWYAECGVADTVAGRFDAVTMVLTLVILRMERDKELIPPSVHLTELFVDDMDGQLRQAGVGDLVVGKRMGKLMSALGGRIDALRTALPQGRDALMPVLERNVTMIEGANPAQFADAVVVLSRRIDAASAEELLAARI